MPKSASKMKQTPASAKKKSKKKSTSSPSAKTSTPKLPPTTTVSTPTQTPSARKRLRASQLANKSAAKSTSKSATKSASKPKPRLSNTRRQLHPDLDAEDEADGSVNKILQNLGQFVRTQTPLSTKNKEKQKEASELAEALQRADELFNEDMTDTSSSDIDDDPGKQVLKLVNKNKKKTSGKKKSQDSDSDAEIDTSMKTFQKDIDSLKKEDPEFFKFLEENDAGLLDLDDLDMDLDNEEEDKDDNDDIKDEGGNDEHEKSTANATMHGAGMNVDSENDEEDEEVEVQIKEKIKNKKTPTKSSARKGRVQPTTTSNSVADTIGKLSDNEEALENETKKDLKESDDKDEDNDEAEVDDEEDAEDTEDDDDSEKEVDESYTKAESRDLHSTTENDADEKEVNAAQENESESDDGDEEDENKDESEVTETVEEKASPKVRTPKGKKATPSREMASFKTEDIEEQEDDDENKDKTGYSSSEEEDSDDDEMTEEEAAKEAGIGNGINLSEDTGETDDEIGDEDGDNNEGKDNTPEKEEREPNSEGEEAQEDGNDDGDNAEMELDTEDMNEPKNETNGVTIVDMKLLRQLKDCLKSKRSLSACKQLLKILRAGRRIVPREHDSKNEKNEKKQGRNGGRAFQNSNVLGKDIEGVNDQDSARKNNIDIEQIGDGGTITADGGKVRFVSSRAYEQAMNLAIVGIQDALDQMLKPKSKKNKNKRKTPTSGDEDTFAEDSWDPSDSPRWANLEGTVVKPFIISVLGICEGTKDGQTLRFLLKRMERLAPYIIEDDKTKKRMIKIGVRIWSADSVGDGVSEATRLQSYLFLNKMARFEGNTEMVLRACYHAFYTGIGGICNSKTFAILEFCIACLVELWGIDMGASYNTGFLYIRELAMGLRSVLVTVSKEKEKLKTGLKGKGKQVSKGENVEDRIQNWAYVNQLKVWGRILQRYGGNDGELQPLVYPYVQVSLGVMKTCVTPRTYGMRMRIGSLLVELIRETGVMIPVIPALIQILTCSELKRKPSFFTKLSAQNEHNSNQQRKKEVDWRGVLRVGEDVSKSRIFLHGLVDWVILEISAVFAAICRHVSMPEIGFMAEIGLKKAAKEMGVTEWKMKVIGLAQKISEASSIVAQKRAEKVGFTPGACLDANGKSKGMLHIAIPSLQHGKKMGIERMYLVEKERMEREFRMKDEGIGNGKQKKRKNEDGDNDDNDNDGGKESEAPKKTSKKQRNKKKRKVSDGSVPVNTGNDEQDEVEEFSLDDLKEDKDNK